MPSFRLLRHSFGSLAVVVGSILLATCATDTLGPRIGRPAGFAVSPVFPAGARAGGLVLDSVQLVVVRPASETLTVVGQHFPIGNRQVELSAIIPLRDSAESLDLTLQLFAGQVLLFSGTQRGTVHAGLQAGDQISVPVAFVGPGANVATLAISPRDTVVTAGDSIAYGVTALNGQQQAVGQFYTTWTTSSNTITIDPNGRIGTPGTRATIAVVATTPTGISDTATLRIVPAATAIQIVAGDSQSAIAGNRLPAALSVRVLAADSQPVPGVKVTFAVTSGGGTLDSTALTTNASGVAQTGAQLGGTTGQQHFSASLGGGAAVTFTATALPAGPISRIWTGLLGLDWSNPGNWSPVGIPTLLDNLTIGTAVNLPVLSASVVAGNITIDGLGVNLTLNGHTLVTNTLTVVNGATITLDKALDSLLVGGNLDIDAGDELGKLTAGVLTIGGSFTQRGSVSGNSFATSGLRTILNGSGTQTLTFLNPGTSRFSDLLINKSGGSVTTTTLVTVLDSLRILTATPFSGTGALAVGRTLRAVTGGTLGVSQLTMTADSLLMARSSDYGVASTIFNGVGPQIIPALPYQDLLLSGASTHTLSARTVVSGLLAVSGATAALVPNGHTISTGSMRIDGGGLLNMTRAADSVIVGGLFDIDARNESGSLTAGVLSVAGDFIQRGNVSGNSFAATGLRTVLTGAGNQTVTLLNPGAAASRFGTLLINKSAGSVTTPTLLPVTDSLVIATATSLNGTGSATVGRKLLAAAGAALGLNGLTMTADSLQMATPANYGVATTTFNGAGPQLIPALPFGNLILNGGSTHSLTGRTSATGQVTVDGATATLVPAGHTLAAGAFSITNGGLLRMTQPADSLQVSGAADIDGRNSGSDLTAGVFSLGGDLVQRGNVSGASFAPSGTRTVLTGGAAQTLTFLNPGTSFLHDLVVNKSGGSVQTPSTVAVHDSMAIVSPTTVNGTGTFTVGRKLRAANGASLGITNLAMTADSLFMGTPANFAVGTTTFNGSGPQLIPQLPYNNLTLSGGSTHTLTGATTVGGALSVTSTAANLVLGGHTASAGTFQISNGGLLTMTQPTDSLLVAGLFDIDARDESASLTAGVLQVGGNFVQRGNVSAASFAATGLLTILAGAGNQTVTFLNPGLAQSRFRDLEVRKSGGAAILTGPVFVDSSLTVQSGVDTVRGGSITAGALNVNGLVLDNSPLTLNALHTVAPVFNNSTFLNFDPTATQFTINQVGLSLPISMTGLTFLSTPTSGFYVSASQLGLVPLLVSIQSNLVPSAATLLTRLLNGALVTWL